MRAKLSAASRGLDVSNPDDAETLDVIFTMEDDLRAMEREVKKFHRHLSKAWTLVASPAGKSG